MLSRKVLSLTKPKGKIYKTKSFGHFITEEPKSEINKRFVREATESPVYLSLPIIFGLNVAVSVWRRKYCVITTIFSCCFCFVFLVWRDLKEIEKSKRLSIDMTENEILLKEGYAQRHIDKKLKVSRHER